MSDWHVRTANMLIGQEKQCHKCSMCPLGRKKTKHDQWPQVYGTAGRPSKFIIVAQNPGYHEHLQKTPLVGQSGEALNKAIKDNGLSRDDFYITNAVKCYTEGNRAPTIDEINACEPHLRMEFGILRPRLVIALGGTALKILCPNAALSESIGNVVKSEKFGVNVFPIYHPSPRNLCVESRQAAFDRDIAKLCKVVKKYKAYLEGDVQSPLNSTR